MTEVNTLIIGAGITGLVAAKLCAQAGQSVEVLEARNRIGGRVHTDGYDLGASWIHGITDSPVYDACTHFGIDMREFTVGSFQPGGRPIAYADPAGRWLTDAESAAFITDVEDFNEALDAAVERSRLGDSYADAVRAALDTQSWDEERKERVREFHQHRSEEQYGAWWEDLDAHGLDDDWVTGDEVIFPNGFQELAKHLAQGEPDHFRVHLAHEVVSVDTSGERARVRAKHGGAEQVFEAERVLVTVPVGVLKAGNIAFVPPLPQRVTDALHGLSMNAFEKVFLEFPDRFWGDGLYAIRQQGPEGNQWHSWYDLTDISPGPTLLTFAAGPTGEAVRHLSNAEIADSVLTQLRRLYGETVPDPVSVRVTSWWSDPFALGSYAFTPVGTREESREALAEPVSETLLLAGEATWVDDPATVTAALMSGHRAAEHLTGRTISLAAVWALNE